MTSTILTGGEKNSLSLFMQTSSIFSFATNPDIHVNHVLLHRFPLDSFVRHGNIGIRSMPLARFHDDTFRNGKE